MHFSKLRNTAFFIVAIYFILLLTSNFTKFPDIHHKYFINKNNLFFSSFKNGGIVLFSEIPGSYINKYEPYDALIKLTSQQQKDRAIKNARKNGQTKVTYEPVQYHINSWNSFGILYIFLLSISIALPISIKNKIVSCVISLIVLELFFTLKIWTLLNLRFSIWYKKFEVGFNAEWLTNAFNYFWLIITYPFFGMMFIVIIIFLINSSNLKLSFKTSKISS